MKKTAILMVAGLMVLMGLPAHAEFKDVPAKHWASPAVAKAVQMGVLAGYPDGTYRGNKFITRYEIAAVVAKLADSAGASGMDKLEAELKSELRAIKSTLAKMRGQGAGNLALSGKYQFEFLLGNMLAGRTSTGASAARGPAVNQQFVLSASRNVSDNMRFRVNLDTMDAGYFGGAEGLMSRLLDFEGAYEVTLTPENPISVTLTAGPGPQLFTATSAVYQDRDNTVYWRPYTGIASSIKLGGYTLGGAYTIHKFSAGGVASAQEIKTSLGTTWNGLPWINTLQTTITTDYFFTALGSGASKDLIGWVDFVAPVNANLMLTGKVGIGSFTPSNMLVSAGMKIKNAFDGTTTIDLRATKVGGQFITQGFVLDQTYITGLDVFNRTIPNGVLVLDAEIVHAVNEGLRLRGRADLRLAGTSGYGANFPGSQSTWEGGFLYDLAPNTTLLTSYRLFLNPTSTTDDTSDHATVGVAVAF